MKNYELTKKELCDGYAKILKELEKVKDFGLARNMSQKLEVLRQTIRDIKSIDQEDNDIVRVFLAEIETKETRKYQEDLLAKGIYAFGLDYLQFEFIKCAVAMNEMDRK